jgi:hypothetical protein
VQQHSGNEEDNTGNTSNQSCLGESLELAMDYQCEAQDVVQALQSILQLPQQPAPALFLQGYIVLLLIVALVRAVVLRGELVPMSGMLEGMKIMPYSTAALSCSLQHDLELLLKVITFNHDCHTVFVAPAVWDEFFGHSDGKNELASRLLGHVCH